MILFESPRSKISLLINPQLVKILEINQHGLKLEMVDESEHRAYDITYSDIEEDDDKPVVSKSKMEVIN